MNARATAIREVLASMPRAEAEPEVDVLKQIQNQDEKKPTSPTLSPAPASPEHWDKPWERVDREALAERRRVIDLHEAGIEEEKRQHRIREAWEKSGVGRRFRDSRLDNYQAPTESHSAALAACRQAVDDFGAGGGALLLGDPEGGKTHLLCGMLLEAAIRGMTIRYITAEDFYLGLRSRMDDGLSESGFIDRLTSPDVLALDDLYCLAAAKSTHDESYQYRMLWTLLDRRYRDAKATIAGTNKPLEEFRDMLDERTRRRLEARVVHVPRRVRQ